MQHSDHIVKFGEALHFDPNPKSKILEIQIQKSPFLYIGGWRGRDI